MSALLSGRTDLPPQLLHDLRSPLNQIIGYAEMLAEDAEAQRNEGLYADLGRIREAGRSMLEIIEQNFAPLDGGLRPVESSAGRVSIAEPEFARPAMRTDVGLMAVGNVLVVDDEATNRDVLSRRLKRHGHKVCAASSGEDALRMMGESPFDIVLLDVMMPDMDGYEVLRRIKSDERLQHIPVIMISALQEVDSVVRCIEAGADDYLPKPFNPTLLKARIGACLERKRGHDREARLFQQVQKNFKRLEEVEKLRDDMRNMIVHDLRTPLTSVIIGVEMLEKHGDLNDTQREMMSIAAGGGKTLLAMINDLLDIEKMESGTTRLQYSDLSATTLVKSAVDQVASLAADAQASIVIQIPPGLREFAGDENKLSRILVNLIANAIKFSSRGVITISVSGDDQVTRFAVRDTGDGIPAEAFDRIFEKFGQLDGHKVGTGLGLAFCKLAVEAHDGRIGVESEIGEGSTFWFTIPVVPITQR